MSARALVVRLLGRMQRGRLVVLENGGRAEFGDPASPVSATVRINDPRAWRALLRGSTGLAESYAEGLWDTDDPVSVIRVAAMNLGGFDRVRRLMAPALRTMDWVGHLTPGDVRAANRHNIAAHYDLGNDLFKLFLDDAMVYSCAFFASPGVTLEEAQEAKLDRLCQALQLRPDDHLVEIGTGWGGMAVHAASRYGCRVTTTTISREQHAYATALVAERGLDDRVNVVLEDYRDLKGTYDKLVSVEMIEAVAWRHLGGFFERCSQLLRPDGLMALQAIVIDDRAYDVEKLTKTFINTVIFPGGCLPSVEAMQRCIARHTDMRTVWLEDITMHYAETLRRWRERFLAAEAEAERLGYDRRFRRMWEMYFAYCEAGFREYRIGDVQMLFAKPAWRGELPLPAVTPHAVAA